MEVAVASASASAMDFHALSRRELQALCKRNGVRANMTNAAMAEALQGLPSVDGIDEKSVMKSAAKAAGEDHQLESPLPRGRRVSVKSPEAIRMDVEEGDDEAKRDLVKEIVRTPGVALRSTSRPARATPAPIPIPATRRSQRTAARKVAGPVEAEQRVEVSTAKRTTTRSARSKVMIDLDQDQEVEVAAPKEEKVEQEEPKAVASDVKCHDPEEEEVTKILDGDNKEEEPEEGEEVVSDKSSDDLKVEEVAVVVEEEATKPQDGIVEEHEPISVEKSAFMFKAEVAKPVTEKAQDALLEDGEGSAKWSPATEMTDEINPVGEDKEVSVDEEAFKEDDSADEDDSAEEDYFTSDLSPEFDNVMVLIDAETISDAETEGYITLPGHEEPQAADASATKTAVKPLDDSAMSEEQKVSSEEVSEDADVTEEAMNEVDNTVDTNVKSLDQFTIKEGTQQDEEEKLNTEPKAVVAKETQKQRKLKDLNKESLRKLKSMYKEAKEGEKQALEAKRQPLEEVDDNACA